MAEIPPVCGAGLPADGDGGVPARPPQRRLRFPKAARLTRAGEFRRVREEGKSLGGKFLVLGVLAEATPGRDSCVGLITSRRVGMAVTRNLVRRRLREAVRQSRPQLRPGCWLVLVARHTAARASQAELAADWLRLARRAGILLPAPALPLPPTSSSSHA